MNLRDEESLGRCRSTPVSYVADDDLRKLLINYGSFDCGRVTLSSSLRNSVQVCKGRPGTHTISFVPRGILADVRTVTLLT
jgi:hypothetical protein